jgi:hypothetical protein
MATPSSQQAKHIRRKQEGQVQKRRFRAARWEYIGINLSTYCETHLQCGLPKRDTLKCIIIETRADSVAVKSNGLKPVLAAIMHPGRLF